MALTPVTVGRGHRYSLVGGGRGEDGSSMDRAVCCVFMMMVAEQFVFRASTAPNRYIIIFYLVVHSKIKIIFKLS